MSSSNDPHAADRHDAQSQSGQDALIARARELIADPDYPTEDIVEELAEMLTHHAGDPAGN